jgi:hypothetical protein
MQPYGLQQLCDAMFKVTPDLILYLPRTSDLNQLAKYAPAGQQTQVVHYCMDGASKVRISSAKGQPVYELTKKVGSLRLLRRLCRSS